MSRHPGGPVLARLLYHSVALVVMGLFGLPLVWMVSASLRMPGLPPPRTIEWLPDPVVWSNYQQLFALAPFGSYIANSLLVVLLAVPLTVLAAALAGFGLTLVAARTRQVLVLLSLGLLLVPGAALWLPRVVLYKNLLVLDTTLALVLPAVMGTSPFFVLLFYWTFRRISPELFDAARLDGAGPLALWWLVALPLARPTILAVGMLAFVYYWGDIISPLLYLKSEGLYTLPVGLQFLQQMDRTNLPLLLAGAVLMTLPVVLLFVAVQRSFWFEGRFSALGEE